MESVPSPAPPNVDDLVSAHNAFLSDAETISARFDRPKTLRDIVSFVLFIRLLRISRAVQALCEVGYAEEAKPLARGALSAAIAMKLIVCDDLRATGLKATSPIGSTGAARGTLEIACDARAAAYLAHVAVIRRRQNASFLEKGLVDSGKINEVEAAAAFEDAKSLSALSAVGITPAARLGTRSHSWHGLSDEEAADRVGMGDWYARYYRAFSEESHVSEPAIRRELDGFLSESDVSTGPQHEHPYPVLRASVDAVSAALLSLARHYGVRASDEVQSIAQPLVSALHREEMTMEGRVFRRLFTG